MLLKEQKFKCYTDYSQFVMRDKANESLPPENLWAEPENVYISESDGIFYIATRFSMDTDFRVQIYDEEPEALLSANQIIEFSINIPSGELVVEEIIKGSRLNIVPITPGKYRTRVHLFIGSSENGEDFNEYCIFLWPSEANLGIDLKKTLIFR